MCIRLASEIGITEEEIERARSLAALPEQERNIAIVRQQSPHGVVPLDMQREWIREFYDRFRRFL